MTYKIEFKFTDRNMKLPTTHICENYNLNEYFIMLENEFRNKIYIHTSEIDYFTVTNVKMNEKRCKHNRKGKCGIKIDNDCDNVICDKCHIGLFEEVESEDNEKWCSDCKHQGGIALDEYEVDVWCNHPKNESRNCDYNENGDCKYYEEI